MDTLSRDSNSSSSVLPLVGVIAGALGLILAIVALVKLSALQKTVAEHAAEIPRIATIEGEVRASATKTETDLKNLRDGVQNAFNTFGEQLGTINGKIAKIEEAQKAKPVAAAKGGAAAAPTGVLNADGTYSVAPGDSLYKIARKFAVKLDALEAENPGIGTLKVGQKVRIPKK